MLAPIVGTRLYEAAPHLTWPVIGALGLCASAGLAFLARREAA